MSDFNHKLEDLVDVGSVSQMFKLLYQVSTIPNALIDMEGEILAGAGWQSICTDFHRKNPASEVLCRESDTHISDEIAAGRPYCVYECPLGLVDSSCPVIIDGHHIGNVFTGQMLHTPLTDDMRERFKAQAKQYGYAESAYLEALEKVPVFPLEKHKEILKLLANIAEQLGNSGLVKLRALEQEKQLQDSEANLTSLINNRKESIWSIDNNYDYLIFNSFFKASYFATFNIELEKGLNALDILTPELKDFWKSNYDKAFSGERVVFEISNQVENALHFYEISLNPIIKADQIIGVSGLSVDITDRKQVEGEIKQKNSSLSALLEITHNFTKTLDQNTILQAIVDSATSLVELDSGAIYLLKGEDLYLEATTPPLAPQFPEEFRHALLRDHPHIGQAVSSHLPIIVPDTKTADLTPAERAVCDSRDLRSLLYLPLMIENRVLGVVILGTVGENVRLFSQEEIDLYRSLAGQATLALENARLYDEGKLYADKLEYELAERKQAEEALRQSEYLLRESQIIANLGSYVLDISQGKWVSSSALDDIFGIGPEYAKDISDWLQIVHPDDLAMMQEYFAKDVLTNHNAFNKEYRILRVKDEQVRWVLGMGELELNAKGDPIKMIGIIQDITDRKQADLAKLDFEKRLMQTQKLESLGVLAGGIAHDFNNILMGILGYADLALSELDSFSQARTYVQGINDASHKAADLIKQMLAYSGKGKFSLEPINLNDLIEDTAQMLAISISKNVFMKFNYSSEAVFLEGDPSQIRQIIMNMVINASDAIGKKSGVISVTTGSMYCDHDYIESTGFEAQINRQEPLPEGMYLFLEISDSGIGMSKETLAKIFEPFYTTKFIGRGLGLSAVLGIVGGHHGMVKIYSEKGKGTTFKVLFPLFEDMKDSKSGTANSLNKDNDWQGQGTFLIADDEEAVRTVGKHMIKKLGYDVLTAVDGLEAIEIFREHADKIVGVLLDLTMPHKDGAQVFREIRALKPDIKVILSSGYNEQDATQQFVGKGLAGFIQKPYVTRDLTKKIKEVMGLTKPD